MSLALPTPPASHRQGPPRGRAAQAAPSAPSAPVATLAPSRHPYQPRRRRSDQYASAADVDALYDRQDQAMGYLASVVTALQEAVVPRAEYEARWSAQERTESLLSASVDKLASVVERLSARMENDFTKQRDFDTALTESREDRRQLWAKMESLEKRQAQGLLSTMRFSSETINRILLVAVSVLGSFAVYTLTGMLHR